MGGASLETASPSPLVEVRDVWMRKGERWIHRGVTLDVARGESLAVIGASGAGKSTLLRTLLGLERPTRGEVRVDGLVVGTAGEQELYALMRRIGMMFQFGALFDSHPVWENVSFGLRRRGLPDAARRRVATEKLKMVGLHEVEDLLPGQLSGGMRKRVGLARAIAHDPEILFCDEPTSGLDPIMSAMISELIVQLRERLGATTITVTHDMRSAYAIADRIAFIHDGRVLVCDTPERIQATTDPVVRQFIEGRARGPIRPDADGRRPA
jgi:phospholipid/cholesterol/gamma-HCH transport system ATP-binding protein